MVSNSVIAYVSKADGNEIRVDVFDASITRTLIRLGFLLDAKIGMYTKTVLDLVEKAEIFNELRNEGVCFLGGKEWSPSEVFEFLRQQNFLVGSFKRISWVAPNEVNIMDI